MFVLCVTSVNFNSLERMICDEKMGAVFPVSFGGADGVCPAESNGGRAIDDAFGKGNADNGAYHAAGAEILFG